MAGHQRERRKRRGRTWNSQRHDSDGGRTCVYTDNGGAYSIPSVRPGLHIFRLHSESRPDGFRFADRDTTLVKIAERGTVRLDFPLVPVDGNGNGNGNGYLNGNGNGNGSTAPVSSACTAWRRRYPSLRLPRRQRTGRKLRQPCALSQSQVRR